MAKNRLYYYTKIAQSRVATFDVYSLGQKKHHVSALLEFDVTHSKKKLRELRKSGENISFNAWIIKMGNIAITAPGMMEK